MKDKRHFGKWTWKAALLAVAVAAAALSICLLGEELISMTNLIGASDTLLIDPGHGGMDGGASSADGTTEKDINLAIALYLREMAEADGWKVVMTREVDKSLGERKNNTIRSMKTKDLIVRRDMIRDVAPTAAVSIHLNSFRQDSSVRGAQSFYPAGSGEQSVLDESRRLAETIQEQLITGLADGNDREALTKRDVLMFKNPTVPMVIVECGFLSNPEEARLLKQADYQRRLAELIYEGIMLYTGKEPREPIRAIDSRG